MRRKYKRVAVRKDEARVETVVETKAAVSDLSMLGMGVKAPRRLKPGSTCLVSISCSGSPMILRGTTVWERFAGWSVKPGGLADPLYSAGIRFDDQRQDLMKQIGSEAGENSRPTRITTSGLTALLSYAESLRIVNLSYGGVLAESCNPLETGDECIIRLLLPVSVKPLRCTARIAFCYCAKGRPEKTYHIGIEFASMDKTYSERLMEFIRMRSVV